MFRNQVRINSQSLELRSCMWNCLYINGCHSFWLYYYYWEGHKSLLSSSLVTDECTSFVICRMCFHPKCCLLNTDLSQNYILWLLLCSSTAQTDIFWCTIASIYGFHAGIMLHWFFKWTIFMAQGWPSLKCRLKIASHNMEGPRQGKN